MRKSIKKIAATMLAATMVFGTFTTAFGFTTEEVKNDDGSTSQVISDLDDGEYIYLLGGNATGWNTKNPDAVLAKTDREGVVSFKFTVPAPVIDEEGKVVTKADLAFLDKDGNHNYCEVKMAPQIIDNIRNYYEDEKLENGNYEDKDNEIIKYKNIGKKLINQVCKLKKTNKKVIVVVPEDCIIDNVIKNELLKQDVEIKRIAIKFKDLEMLTKKIIDDFIKEYNKKTHSKTK